MSDVPSLIKALQYLETTSGAPKNDAEVRAWCNAEAALLSALAAARPRNPDELAMKAEVALRRLLEALDDGDMAKEVELGLSVLRDIRAAGDLGHSDREVRELADGWVSRA